MTKSILITGASAGIGQHLAQEFAARGYHLALTARRLEPLQDLQKRIAAKYPALRVEVRSMDVTALDTVAPCIEELATALGGLDIVVANAGIGDGGGAIGTGGFARDAAIIQANVLGAMATMDAGIAIFRRQQRGQVVAIASVAAARGLPGAGSYSASKAAIAVFAEAARAELYHTPIRVTTLFPGYIDTAINQRMKSRPFLVSVEEGAKQIAGLIERRVQTSAVPVLPWSLVMRLMRWMPLSALAKQNPFAQ
ncbi:MAG: SDR family oxidoreductase [Pseudomonadota bacterium]